MKRAQTFMSVGVLLLVSLFISTGLAQAQSEGPQPAAEPVTAEEMAARDAEFDRLVAEAEAYERGAAPQTPEDIAEGRGLNRERRVELYKAALAARPGDPRNVPILYRIAQAYHCSFNAAAGEKPDFGSAGKLYEELLETAEENADPHIVLSARICLAGIYYHNIKQHDRVVDLVRPILLMPFPDIEPPLNENQPRDYYATLTQEEQYYLVQEKIKVSALRYYYEITQRENSPETRVRALQELARLPLGRNASLALEEYVKAARKQ